MAGMRVLKRAGAQPPSRDPVQVYLDLARRRVAAPAPELERAVAERLGLDPAAAEPVLAEVVLELADDPGSPLVLLPPDLVVHVPALVDGSVLTHRLTATEQAGGHLDLDADLGPFARLPAPRVRGGLLHDDGRAWHGPDGWLADLPSGALLAVRGTAAGEITVSVLEDEPGAAPAAVAALRAVYDAGVAASWLPLSGEQLVAGVLHRDRSAFAQPVPPLSELAAAAGLERRADEFAHEESVWLAAATLDRRFRLAAVLPSDEQVAEAEAALTGLTGSDEPAALRGALDRLEDPEVIPVVVDELLHPDGDPARVTALVALADRLVAVAGSSPRAAVACWIAAVAAERSGRPSDAESHLRAGSVAADGWPLVEDRLAWYESDRGDAAAALGRWTAIEAPDDDPDVVVVRRFAAIAGPAPSRNAPCWCGSGRKSKQCHRGRPTPAPLPERVDWLYRKAVAYLERRGGTAAEVLDLHADVLAGLDDGPERDPAVEEQALAAAYADPLPADAALHEGRWFERFLADRGPLLPADEAGLAASWLPVARTVYEVLDAPSTGPATLRDLRTEHHLVVTGAGAATAGTLLCGRAVPDGGGGHRFVGAVFAVPTDRAAALLAALGGQDALGLLEAAVEPAR